MMVGLIDAVDAAGTDDARARDRPARGRGDHFCGGADIVARNADRSARPRTGSIQRRLPAQAHRLIPLLDDRADPGRVQGAGLGGRHRVPARARRRLHHRRRRRPLLGAVHRTRLHPRQRRHLVAAAPRRRGAGAGAAAARPRSSAATKPPSGARSTARFPAAALDGAVDELVDSSSRRARRSRSV